MSNVIYEYHLSNIFLSCNRGNSGFTFVLCRFGKQAVSLCDFDIETFITMQGCKMFFFFIKTVQYIE